MTTKDEAPSPATFLEGWAAGIHGKPYRENTPIVWRVGHIAGREALEDRREAEGDAYLDAWRAGATAVPPDAYEGTPAHAAYSAGLDAVGDALRAADLEGDGCA